MPKATFTMEEFSVYKARAEYFEANLLKLRAECEEARYRVTDQFLYGSDEERAVDDGKEFAYDEVIRAIDDIL